MDKTVVEKFASYISNDDGWGRCETDQICYYYQTHPEFTIHILESENMPDYRKTEKWVPNCPDESVGRSPVHLKYNTTTIKKYYLIDLDGFRYQIIEPELKSLGDSRNYYYVKDSIRYYLARFLFSRSRYNREGFPKFLKRGPCPIHLVNNKEDI